MAKLLGQLAGQCDTVLIGTPPLLPVTDEVILPKTTGGTLVVAGAGTLRQQQFADGLGSLEDVRAPVLGVVLNRLMDKQTYAYPYHYYSDPASVSHRKFMG